MRHELPTFDEETARAELYGLLALLLYAPPSADTLAALRVAVTQAPASGGVLEQAWQNLIASCRTFNNEAIQDEYQILFGGMGKPEVYLYASHYLSGFLNEKPLAQLRTDLAALDLSRDESMPETEDHIAYLCEVMRYLIAGEDAGVANLAQQQKFFSQHFQPWVSAMCDAISTHPKAQFYAQLSKLTQAFMDVEAQGFDMLP